MEKKESFDNNNNSSIKCVQNILADRKMNSTDIYNAFDIDLEDIKQESIVLDSYIMNKLINLIEIYQILLGLKNFFDCTNYKNDIVLINWLNENIEDFKSLIYTGINFLVEIDKKNISDMVLNISKKKFNFNKIAKLNYDILKIHNVQIDNNLQINNEKMENDVQIDNNL